MHTIEMVQAITNLTQPQHRANNALHRGANNNNIMFSKQYVRLDTITLALLSSKYSMMQSGNGDGNKWKKAYDPGYDGHRSSLKLAVFVTSMHRLISIGNI